MMSTMMMINDDNDNDDNDCVDNNKLAIQHT